MLEIILNLAPWALLVVFGLFAISVKEVRIVSSVIVISALMNMAMAGVYEQGTTLVFLYKGAFDTVTALILLLIYGHMEAKKAPEQAIVFILGAFSHGWLVYEVFVDDVYWFYDYYDYAMWGLTAAHFLVMGDYYERLYKNIKKTLATRVFNSGLALRLIGRLGNKQQRNDGVGNTVRRGSMGPFRSGTYDKTASHCKESTGHNGS